MVEGHGGNGMVGKIGWERHDWNHMIERHDGITVMERHGWNTMMQHHDDDDMGEDVEIEVPAEDKFTNDLDPSDKK